METPPHPEPLHNFTPRAQQALALARKEADRLGHGYVGTGHLLIGIVKLGQGPAVAVLFKMGMDLESVRAAVVKEVDAGHTAGPGTVPFTPSVKKALALAGKEAKSLNHSYLGTEHLLLGLLREGEDVAARVLKSFSVDLERTRTDILHNLAASRPAETPTEAEEWEITYYVVQAISDGIPASWIIDNFKKGRLNARRFAGACSAAALALKDQPAHLTAYGHLVKGTEDFAKVDAIQP